MIRLPAFEVLFPASVGEALEMLAAHPGSVPVGAGTDLLPNMKRRQVHPGVLVSLARIPGLFGIDTASDGTTVIGASTPLAQVADSTEVSPAMREAAALVASPQIRNTATIGGNLCVDTRCAFINVTEEWRTASGPCLKAGGDVCWVAPKGSHCYAISSSDLAPAAIVSGASVRLVGPAGERVLPVSDLYRPDGIDHMARRRDEILTQVLVPPAAGLRTTYLKLRRRQAVDFPMLGVAAGVRLAEDGTVSDARIVLGAVSPAPLRAVDAEALLLGRRLDRETIAAAAELAAKPVRPFDNADLGSRYRKWMAAVFVERALGALAAP
ncbi:MAG: xanthine dehydrogenase family protein subunit M [Acidimicrobiia bacterium]|nr:MAG: xanthine dehydrogenase family protein subunit M [Acidimicrobiia bacterium]